MISLTQNAAKKIKDLVSKEKEAGKLDKNLDYGLRLGVRGGGCSGFEYVLDFDTATADDHVFEADGTKVFVDQKSILYLNGVQVDYVETLTQSGFKINNPNSTGSCGCGNSVSF